MNIIVIGLGSMGRRRIRLLQKISNEYTITGIDSNPERCKQAEEELGISTMSDLTEALDSMHPECAVISTSPLSHSSLIETCLQAGCHVFTELNLVKDGYDTNIALAKEKNRVLFLSSTFLYRDEISYIRKRVSECNEHINYTYHVGQYLPDWHPWESIKDYFVGDKRTNGCRELFAIELPWIIKTFGPIKSYKALASQNTELSIEYNDNYMLMIEHENGHKGLLAVDVLSRKAVRNLEVYSEHLYLSWNGAPTGLFEYDFSGKRDVNIDLYESVDKQEGYASFVIENAYQSELETFIEVVKGNQQPLYTFEDDMVVLDIIDDFVD